ncbi:MAG: hypothetical protein ACK5MR_18850 [Cumulibacter sp.]
MNANLAFAPTVPNALYETTEAQLTSAHEKVRSYQDHLDAARDDRDDAIRAAIAEGMSAYRVAQITGLSQRAVHKIRDAADA